MNTYPMIALGDEKYLERVSSTFDFAMGSQQFVGEVWASEMAICYDCYRCESIRASLRAASDEAAKDCCSRLVLSRHS